MNPSIVKRCLAGAVLVIVAMLPGFQQFHTSVEGLKLIADYEGCRPQLYQCSTGAWTDGIGNTSGIISGKTTTERQAAEGLISNMLRVGWVLERCVRQQPPLKVYDATVSFASNVGMGNACSFTLVKLLNQWRWTNVCRQLPRWVYVRGVFNQELDNRRAWEMVWCLQGANWNEKESNQRVVSDVMSRSVNRRNGVSAEDFSGIGSIWCLGSLSADMGSNSGVIGCAN